MSLFDNILGNRQAEMQQRDAMALGQTHQHTGGLAQLQQTQYNELQQAFDRKQAFDRITPLEQKIQDQKKTISSLQQKILTQDEIIRTQHEANRRLQFANSADESKELKRLRETNKKLVERINRIENG